MYPRNASTPPKIAVGAVVQISDGAVQTSGVSIAVSAEGGTEGAGSGSTTYGGSSGIVYYAPTQGETNYTAFVVTAYKTGCIPVAVTVVTTASSVPGNVQLAAAQPATTFASITCTGALTVSDGIVVTCSTDSKSALKLTGGATAGKGLEVIGTGTGTAITATGAVALSSTLVVSGATTLTGLTTGAISATTIASSGTTTLNALTVTGACTHGSTVLGNTTMGTLTQTGAVSWGATTFASITVTGALGVATLTSSGTTTLNALTVTNATTLSGGISTTTIAASGAVTAASLTMSGALQAATIVSTGTTTLNALTVTGACTHGSTVLGNTTMGTLTQTGAVSVGATTLASLVVSGTTTLSGAVTLSSTLGTGAVTFASLAVTGALSVGTTTTLAGAVSFGSTWGVTGAITATAANDIRGVALHATQGAYAPSKASDIPTAATIVDAVWDEVLHTDHEVSNSASVLLQASGSAADPWLTALPGAYGAGSAGYIIGNFAGGVTDWTANERTAIRSILGVPVSGTTPDDPSTGICDTIRDHLTGIKGATWSGTTDTLEAIRDRGDAAWITATGFSTHNAAAVVSAMGTGTFLTAVPWNASWDAEVQSECTDALNAYDPPTKAETDTAALTALTTAMTESYAADGAAPTPAQALFLIQQALTEFAISSTTITVKKIDGSATAATFTLDDDTTPTSRTRAT